MRDRQLLRDVALSHVLSRDQIIELGYFGSVCRCNTRLRGLRALGLIKAVETPFYGQSLYAVGSAAKALLGERISQIVSNRTGSPRFLQHALATTNLRIQAIKKGASSWRFEQQLWTEFAAAGRIHQVRPDGLFTMDGRAVAVEMDLGHVAPSKLSEKLKSYQRFIATGAVTKDWGVDDFDLLVITTGKLRASRIRRLAAGLSPLRTSCYTAEEYGVTLPGAWS